MSTEPKRNQMPFKILVSPCPTWSGGPHINVSRVIEKLKNKGCTFRGKLFHYTGFHPGRFDLIWMSNNPRRMNKILSQKKPVVVRMGQFAFKECSEKIGLKYTSWHERQRDEMVRAVCEADRVVFISNWVKENFEREFARRNIVFDADKCDVILNGVDLELFHPAINLRDRPFTIGTSGRIRNRFRLDTFFEISRMLSFEHRLLIVGALTEQCKECLDGYLQDPVLNRRTEYLGRLKPNSLPPVYQRMSCLLHPVAGESCSTVIPEALACGVPVVVPEYGAPSEYIGRGGIAVPGERWDYYNKDFRPRMADAVERVYREHTIFSAEARRSAELRLDLDKAAEKWLQNFQLARGLL